MIFPNSAIFVSTPLWDNRLCTFVMTVDFPTPGIPTIMTRFVIGILIEIKFCFFEVEKPLVA
jgi:hypothetical protein